MANWALVENGEITMVCDNLPTNWRNMSGFYHLESDPQRLASLGWVPVVKAHQQYDPILQSEIGVQHALVDGEVRETLIIVPRTQPNSIPGANKNMQDLRMRRNKLLADTDWAMLEDARDTLTDLEYGMIRKYRRELRDLPAKYAGMDFTIESVEWPRIETDATD